MEMEIIDPELSAMYVRASRRIKDTTSPDEERKMRESDKRWGAAKKWRQLLGLNKRWKHRRHMG